MVVCVFVCVCVCVCDSCFHSMELVIVSWCADIWLLYLAIKLIAVPISAAKQQQQANVDSGLPRAIRLNTTSQQVVSASPVVSVLLFASRQT